MDDRDRKPVPGFVLVQVHHEHAGRVLDGYIDPTRIESFTDKAVDHISRTAVVRLYGEEKPIVLFMTSLGELAAAVACAMRERGIGSVEQ